MSLSLIITASSRVGDRSWRLADVATASATRRHWEGVQAGVCQRIFSFTAQIVFVRQVSVGPSGRVAEGDAGATEAAVVMSAAETGFWEAIAKARMPVAATVQYQCFWK